MIIRPSDARPTVFIPVEIKVREFRPKLLVAARAARRGMRVYIGSKTAIRAAITARSGPDGVYFAKGGDRLEVIAEAKRHCSHVIVQDEEIGPAMSRAEVANAWRTRYHADLNEVIDRVLLYTEQHRPILADIYPDLASRSVVTGWPRFDLWRDGYRDGDERLADRLRARHGDFALYVSNFKVNTEAQRQHKIADAREKSAMRANQHGATPPSTDGVAIDPTANDYGTHASSRLAAYQRAVELLRQVASASPLPVIVRPHPAENPEAWRHDLAGTENVSVVFDGEIDPWLLAARAMLHTGCTTAVQAFHYRLPSGYLTDVGYLSDDFAETLSRRLSTPLTGLDSIEAFLGAPHFAPEEPGASEPLEGTLVSDRIVDELQRLAGQPEQPVGLPTTRVIRSWLAAGRAILAERASRLPGRRRAFYGTNAQPKLPGGLHAREARRFLAALPDIDGVRVREVRHNLLRIEQG